MPTITVQTDLTTINCGKCGGIYAIQSRFYNRCREQGESWTCPYCTVGWGFSSGDSENSRLKKQLSKLETTLNYLRGDRDNALKEAKHFRRSRDGMHGALAKMKKRVGRGVCPCCNRHFENLRRHMESQHPEVAGGDMDLSKSQNQTTPNAQ